MVDAGRLPTVVIPFSIPTPPESCSVTARILFEIIRAQLVICVAEMPAHAYSGHRSVMDGSGPFGLVSTRAAAHLAINSQASASKRAPLLPLPPGDSVVGLAAAVISCAHVCHLQFYMPCF
jgi:hypothetical protein